MEMDRSEGVEQLLKKSGQQTRKTENAGGRVKHFQLN
jgi:hypothetical protein